METILITAGGVINLLFVIFHLLFWKVFKWPASPAVLDKRQAAIMQVLNIHLAIALLAFTFVSLVYPFELVSTPLGRAISVFIAAFWLIRAVNQYLFWGAAKIISNVLFGVCLINGLLYAAALVMSR